MKTSALRNGLSSIVVPVLLCCGALTVQAQGTFQNLDFESANLTPIPSGQYGGLVPIADALPDWEGRLGSNQVTQVLQNNFTIGSGSIDILGPDWTFGTIIEGQYNVVLQAGGLGKAAIAQTSLIPVTSKSLQFKTGVNIVGPYEVTIDGQTISMIPLLSTGTYTLLGGDISAFAGQNKELRIAALPGNSFFPVDSIEFSPQIVPESSTLGLFAFGGLLFSWRLRKS